MKYTPIYIDFQVLYFYDKILSFSEFYGVICNDKKTTFYNCNKNIKKETQQSVSFFVKSIFFFMLFQEFYLLYSIPQGKDLHFVLPEEFEGFRLHFVQEEDY